MNVILLGSNGFIGSKIRQALIEHNIDFLTLDRNFRFQSFFPPNIKFQKESNSIDKKSIE